MKKRIYLVFLNIILIHSVYSQKQSNVINPKLLSVTDTVLPTPNTFLLEIKFLLPNNYPYYSCISYQYGKDTAYLNLKSDGVYTTLMNIERKKINFHIPVYNDFILKLNNIEANKKYIYEVNFGNQVFNLGEIRYDFGKPIIYLYPENETEISVQLDFKGELFFTYPEYKNGWNCIAQPDGTLNIDNQFYSYLFWEGNANIDPDDVYTKNGQNISTDTLVSYFENTLNKIGFKYQEKEDFITYWVPKMKQFNHVFIYYWDKRYNDYSDLNIMPKPDNIYKLFMIWSPCDKEDFKNMSIQNLPQIKRDGFSVLEWGGTMVDKQLFIPKLEN